MLYALAAGGVDTGWTFYHALFHEYSPLARSSPPLAGSSSPGFSSILTGINFIATMHLLRTRA